MSFLSRAVNVVVPMVVAALMLVAAVPKDYLGPFADADRCGIEKEGRKKPQSCKSFIVDLFRQVSVSQNWGMYAPSPQRAHAYMMLYAVDSEGNKRELPENEIARNGWGTNWAWKKDRMDIKRHAVGYFRSNKPNRNRVWFMRGICVREARAGNEPVQVRMERVRRGFVKPHKVRKGKPAIGPETTKDVQVMGCKAKIVQDMIEEDRARQ